MKSSSDISHPQAGPGCLQPASTAGNAHFERIARFAARFCESSSALIALQAGEEIVALAGLSEAEAQLATALCRQAALEKSLLLVGNTRLDPRTANLAAAGFLFFVAVPLISEDCGACGALAVLDRKPRDLSHEQLEGLQVMAEQIAVQLELVTQRRAIEAITRQRDQATHARIERSEALLAIA